MLAARTKKSFTEIYEGWSERDVNLMLFYLHCESLANEPDEQTFYRNIGHLLMRE